MRVASQVRVPQAMASLFGATTELTAAGATDSSFGANGEGAASSERAMTSGCTFVVAAPPLAPPFSLAGSGGQNCAGLLTSQDWRASSVLQRTHYLCPQCHFASPVASTVCLNPQCQAVAASVARRSSPEEAAAMQALSAKSSYARRLRFLQGRGQACMPALISLSPALSLTLRSASIVLGLTLMLLLSGSMLLLPADLTLLDRPCKSPAGN